MVKECLKSAEMLKDVETEFTALAEMAKVIKAGFTIVNQENNETEWPAGPLKEIDRRKHGEYHETYRKNYKKE